MAMIGSGLAEPPGERGASGGGMTFYGYDRTGQRVFHQTTESATTSYPDRYYNVASSSLAAMEQRKSSRRGK